MQKEMLPYLQKIISLEQAAYVEESLLNAVRNERENTDTRKYVVPEPKPPERATIDTEFFMLITVFIGGPIAIGVGVLRLINTLDLGAGFGAAFIVFAIFAFLVFLWVAVDAKQDNDDRKEKYQQALAQYPIDVQNEEDAYQQALRLAEYYDQLIAQQEKKLADTRRLLQGAYDKGLLYGKYRNFVAVCSICEYLESGRCSELGGPDGAYNLFEQEIRANMVITQLGSILSKLDRIQANQAMLYDAISTGNRLTSQLIERTNESIRLGEYNAQQNAITAYNTQQTAREVSFSNWMRALDI